jgi:hypothetical protein
MAMTAGVIGLTLYTVNEQEKRASRVEKEQKAARRVEAAERANQARKSRREQVREARIRQAQIENQSATAGQTGSSAAIAAGDSLTAKLGTNIGNINEALAFGSAKSTAEQNILDANRKSTGEILGGVGIQAANIYASSK